MDLDRIAVYLTAEVGHGLAVVDPLMAFLGAEVNSNREQDVRRALCRLKLLAESRSVKVAIRVRTSDRASAAARHGAGSPTSSRGWRPSRSRRFPAARTT